MEIRLTACGKPSYTFMVVFNVVLWQLTRVFLGNACQYILDKGLLQQHIATVSAKEKSVGEWSVPPYDLLLFLPHCTSCEATQFLSVLSMLYENWVCGL